MKWELRIETDEEGYSAWLCFTDTAMKREPDDGIVWDIADSLAKVRVVHGAEKADVLDQACEFAQSVLNSAQSLVASQYEARAEERLNVPLRCADEMSDRVNRLLKSETQELWRFEGEILEVHEDSFTAVIADLTDEDRVNEIVEILISEVAAEDRELIQENVLFYWCFVTRLSDGGTESKIKLRRVERE